MNYSIPLTYSYKDQASQRQKRDGLTKELIQDAAVHWTGWKSESK